LRKAIADLDLGKITEEEFHRIEDEVTLEVIDEQIQAGLDLITDGKVRWEDEQTYVARRLTGFTINGLIRYFDSNTYYRQPVCNGRVQWVQPITVRDYQFATQHSSKPVKMALPGPYTLARLSQNDYYLTRQEFVLALADALNKEARALQEAGCPFVQFDEPAILRHKEDWEIFERAMHFLTAGLDTKLALYTYFGDVNGIYRQLQSLPFQVIGLDFVQGAANWQVLESAPFTKELGLGIVDARNTRIEPVRELHSAIERVARLVRLDRVYVNPTCGLEFLPRERAQEKLANMVRAVTTYGTQNGRAPGAAKTRKPKAKTVRRTVKKPAARSKTTKRKTARAASRPALAGSRARRAAR
jgi:5-methyltetrahydropteroyltriglutamate--homocysteine methyltransferase